MIRRPPSPPPFPSAPIFQSRRERARADPLGAAARARRPPGGPLRRPRPDVVDPPRLDRARVVHARRSEEDKSELQSRQYFVCRLLLEKNQRPTISLPP